MPNQPDRGVQPIQPIGATSDTDATIHSDQRNCAGGNEDHAILATDLETDNEPVLFRPRLWFVSED